MTKETIYIPNLNLYSVRDGIVQQQAGLNWGFANAHVNPEDAYIALPRSFFEEYPDFFPQHGSIINVLWDDGTRMRCLLEGTQRINGLIYPKQISSYDDKSFIGHYLRQRLGVSPNRRIDMTDLDNYGRNYISVSKENDSDYYFEFS